MIDILINEKIQELALRVPNKISAIFPAENQRITYKEIHEESNSIAKALLASGVKKNSHIGIWGTNTSRWMLIMFAAAKIGAVVVPININYKEKELSYILKQADIEILFSMKSYKDGSMINTINELFSETDRGNYSVLDEVVVMDENESYGYLTGWSDFEKRRHKISDEELQSAISKVSVKDKFVIQYTSGTTSDPKGAVLSQYGCMNTACAYGGRMHLSNSEITCVPLPLFHCYGNILVLLSSLIYEAPIVIVEYFHPIKVMEAIEKEKCTIMVGVPTMYTSMISNENFHKYNFDSLKRVVIGGSVCTVSLAEKINKALELEQVVIGYGLTEGTSLVTVSDIDDVHEKRINSVGRAIDDVEIRIVNQETKEDVEPGTVGEMLIRGYNVMLEYYKKPEETKKALDSDGWFHTGDLSSVDEDGFYSIIGRCDDTIIRGGENISPSEIENFILEIEDVIDVQVIGVPDEKYGEEIAAFIQVKEEFDTDTILNYLESKIAKYKIPKYIYVIKEFPKTASGKIQKFKLKEMHECTV